MVFLSLAFWILVQSGTLAAASDVGVDGQAPLPLAEGAVISEVQSGQSADTLDYSNASPDRSPAVLPADDAETAGRRSMYLQEGAEDSSSLEAPEWKVTTPAAETQSAADLNAGPERTPNVVDDQR